MVDLKIAYVFPLQTLLPVEGVRNVVFTLASSLSKLGINVSLIGVKVSSTQNHNRLNNRLVPQFKYGEQLDAKTLSLHELLTSSYLKLVNPDVIHIHSANPLFNVFTSAITKHHLGNKATVIASLYSTSFINPFHDLSLPKKMFMTFSKSFQVTMFLKVFTDLVIVFSRKGRETLQRRAGIKNILRFPHIIVDDELKENQCGEMTKYFDSYDRVLFFAGDLTPYRGVEYALALLTFLKHENPIDGILLIIPDKGMYEKNIERRKTVVNLIRKYKLESNIKILGLIPRKELGCVLSKADAVLMPYTSRYAIMDIPLFLAETMYVGGLIISTKVGAIPEILRDRVSGFLVKPDNINELVNIVEEILRDPDKYAYVRSNAKRIARRIFSRNNILSNIMKIYDSLHTTKAL